MSDNKRKIRVGISHGDFNSISYEIILKALHEEGILELFTPVIFGSSEIAARATTRLNMDDFWFATIKDVDEIQDNQVNLIDVCGPGVHQTLGMPTQEAGKAAVVALQKACEALENGDVDVLVTAPINKHTVQSDEFSFPGHTEFLENRFCGEGEKATMILFADNLRVAVVTGHMPLADVPAAITRQRVLEAILNFNKSLKCDFRCERPKIAVLSLNPHAGDDGTLGNEEIDVIKPAIEDAVKEGVLAFGPFAADGLFGSYAYAGFDGILAMYHDQGLAPFKALANGGGVNFTAGLSVVRTSPAHGTAYDKAGSGSADHSSMREAIYQAIDIFNHRNVFEEASANPLEIKVNVKGSKNRRQESHPDNLTETKKEEESNPETSTES